MPTSADLQLVPDLPLAQKNWTNHKRRSRRLSGASILAQVADGGLSAELLAGYCPKTPPLMGFLSHRHSGIAIIETLTGTWI